MLFETMFLIQIIMSNCGCFTERGFIFLSILKWQKASFYNSIISVKTNQERSASRDKLHILF
jgi:hypothetical protein